MKQIKVTIEGVTPLLMNSPKSMLDEATGVTSKTTKRDIKKECDKLAYKMKDGTLYIPSEAIKGCLIGASSYKKIDKFTAKPIIAGGVQITPSEVSLKTKPKHLKKLFAYSNWLAALFMIYNSIIST